MNDDFKLLKETGEWWSEPWWLEKSCLQNVNASKEDVEKSVEYLKGIFTKDWLRNYSGNPVANVLLRNTQYNHGYPQLENLILLSNHLKELNK